MADQLVHSSAMLDISDHHPQYRDSPAINTIDRYLVSSPALINNRTEGENSSLLTFRRNLAVLLGVFQQLPSQDDRTRAVAMTREAVARMQAAVKKQLCNDALKTVAALAESMIQEAYGFNNGQGNLRLSPSPPDSSSTAALINHHQDPIALSLGLASTSSIADQSMSNLLNFQSSTAVLNEATTNSELSVDNADLLTNALYATLQAVNQCELSTHNYQSSQLSIFPQSVLENGAAAISERSILDGGDDRSIQTVDLGTHSPPDRSSPPSFSRLVNASFTQPTKATPSHTILDYFQPLKSTTDFQNSSTDLPVATGSNKILKCSQCEYVASQRQNLHRHEKLHRIRQLPSEQSRKFVCDHCDRRFITKWAVKEHTKYKHKAVAVDTKEKEVHQPSETNQTDGDHQLLVDRPPIESSHSNEGGGGGDFVCEYCPPTKSFPLKSALKRHVGMVHLRHRQYACAYCGKSFSNNYHMTRHVQCVHLELRTHGCTICGKAFTTTYHLKRHLRNMHKME